MTIWITRPRTGSLQAGGLERCRVWFHKPRYTFMDITHDYQNLPFGGGHQREGLYEFGWEVNQSHSGNKEKNSLSLGNWLGYDSEIPLYVWDELCKHYQSEDIGQWDIKDKELDLKRSDFLLEREIEITLKL